MKLVEILNFDEKGLIPVIVQDFYNDEVLMLAYANKEAVENILKDESGWYFSRERKRLWKKGEESGHTQKVKEIYFDCDADALLIKVEQKGAACHTNHRSCFYRRYFRGKVIETEPPLPEEFEEILYKVGLDERKVIDEVYKIITERKETMPEDSYVASLFNEGLDRILKKISEEVAEVILAAKDEKKSHIIYEVTDLVFHLLVCLAYFDIPPSTIRDELKRRFKISGIFEKESR
ncbi:MAG: bifunctional phosphoribosyl-AMP cyclohydrolase/phosphoribosyl-ATP diphosphatase HisIE [Deltaproteobacteria bacterium]|nr:bifunctional phosphoribosyl-AMP cyclohydrolase/phosphoribosyl-ATP diphosphatase HisIE [Deltaproteobacteria bacterium]